MRRRAGAALLALALAAPACQSGSGRSTRAGGRSPRTTAPGVYVALGGDETLGATLQVPLRDVWPQVLYRSALPKETVFYNLATPGELAADALPALLVLADQLRPTVATLWSHSTDAAQIANVVRRLRRNGATRVLVAATNDVVARVATAQGATVVAVAGSPLSPDDHRAVATAFASALRGPDR